MKHVDWDSFDKFEPTIQKYMPRFGEGETLASQVCTAVNKLVYKWYNDGDVYDNNYGMRGWCNDISSYANWLGENVPGASDILMRITKIGGSTIKYEHILYDLAEHCLDDEYIDSVSDTGKVGSVYDCDNFFEFKE